MRREVQFHRARSVLRFAIVAAVVLAMETVAVLRAGTNAANTSEDASHSLATGIRPFRQRVGHDRPLIAVVGESDGTETTDYLIPYGVLSQSGVADVKALGTRSGPITMMPALKILPQSTISEFDRRFPEGADYVIVPAVHNPDDTTLLDWVRLQSRRGAIIVGICDGAWVVAKAGLLDRHRATGHWYSLDRLERTYRATTWLRNRRYVDDGSVVTTTGVTASIPVSLALVEAIAGRDRAMKVARDVGATNWSPVHDSNNFKLNWTYRLTAAGNELAFWSHETVDIPVAPGVDEISLALVADAYSRTYRSQALTVSPSAATIRTRRGLDLIPDTIRDGAGRTDMKLALGEKQLPVQSLDGALEDIARSYGRSTAAFVALQM